MIDQKIFRNNVARRDIKNDKNNFTNILKKYVKYMDTWGTCYNKTDYMKIKNT